MSVLSSYNGRAVINVSNSATVVQSSISAHLVVAAVLTAALKVVISAGTGAFESPNSCSLVTYQSVPLIKLKAVCFVLSLKLVLSSSRSRGVDEYAPVLSGPDTM